MSSLWCPSTVKFTQGTMLAQGLITLSVESVKNPAMVHTKSGDDWISSQWEVPNKNGEHSFA